MMGGECEKDFVCVVDPYRLTSTRLYLGQVDSNHVMRPIAQSSRPSQTGSGSQSSAGLAIPSVICTPGPSLGGAGVDADSADGKHSQSLVILLITATLCSICSSRHESEEGRSRSGL